MQIAAEDNFIILLLIFRENKPLPFHVNHLLTDDSHEMSNLIFSEKKKKKKCLLQM